MRARFNRPRLLLIALSALSSLGARAASGDDKGKAEQMDRYVVNDKHLLSFGIGLTMWEDKNSGRVLEMHVTGVQEGSEAEQDGIVPGTRIYGINGADVCSFLATFAAGGDLNKIFIDRGRGDRVTLEVVRPGQRKSEFFTLVNKTGFTVSVRTKAPASGVAFRTEEKSPVYQGLKNWEKKSVDRGVITTGFTPDMVYIALGEPTNKDSKGFGENQVELWTYRRCYPDPLKIRGFETVRLNLESVTNGQAAPDNVSKRAVAQGQSTGGSTVHPYTIQVLFEGGKVSRMAAIPDDE